MSYSDRLSGAVALRKESVDRNTHTTTTTAAVLPSLSARRAWIEIALLSVHVGHNASLSARRAWIEILVCAIPAQFLASLSARRAWIEIYRAGWPSLSMRVALRKESVDRNVIGFYVFLCQNRSLSARRAWIEIVAIAHPIRVPAVALRKESVDRNWTAQHIHRAADVALRKESVDRNFVDQVAADRTGASLSARRAWIEMTAMCAAWMACGTVALRKESVDRNFFAA